MFCSSYVYIVEIHQPSMANSKANFHKRKFFFLFLFLKESRFAYACELKIDRNAVTSHFKPYLNLCVVNILCVVFQD